MNRVVRSAIGESVNVVWLKIVVTLYNPGEVIKKEGVVLRSVHLWDSRRNRPGAD